LCVEYFPDRVLWTICLGWLWTTILLISASWVAGITGVSRWRLVSSEVLTKVQMHSKQKKQLFNKCWTLIVQKNWTKSHTLYKKLVQCGWWI
jgi:hypothetical protein